ncbi:MAG: LLM class flavin-dependent oxidoreductase [Acetobacteraceae bacterium]
MAADPFHLGYFLQGSSIQAWGQQWTGNISEDWMSADMFLESRALAGTRGVRLPSARGFDLYRPELAEFARLFLKNGMSVPRQEPSVVASLMLAATSRLGIVPTLSTFAYAPYLVARTVGTLDQISNGRAAGTW